jgi:hypothetical protein
VLWSGGEDGTGFLPFPLSWVRPKLNGGRPGHVSHPVKTLGATRRGVTMLPEVNAASPDDSLGRFFPFQTTCVGLD